MNDYINKVVTDNMNAGVPPVSCPICVRVHLGYMKREGIKKD